MGHRKHSAPRRGSLAFRPRGRAKSLIPRIRNWPDLDGEKPTLLGYPAFKAGTIHAITIDDRERTPNFGKPLFNTCTVLSLPQMEIVGMRLYTQENGYDKAMTELHLDKHQSKFQEIVNNLRQRLSQVKKITALISVVPKEVGLSQKKPITMEIGVGGADITSRFDYLVGLLGKKVKFSDVFKPGMYVDVVGITKGKGFEGPITRFGVKRKQHKSRKSVRAVGVLGPWHPAAVSYTVPRAGQMGFHQRTEIGKKVLAIGNEKENPITPPGGFIHFGLIRSDYAIIRGTLPGPPKRLLIVRYPLRKFEKRIAVPQIVEISSKVR